jgi:hypothetical protein
MVAPNARRGKENARRGSETKNAGRPVPSGVSMKLNVPGISGQTSMPAVAVMAVAARRSETTQAENTS